MSAETKKLPPQERLILAGRVNKLCDVEPGEEIDIPALLHDARQIVDVLDPFVKPSGSFVQFKHRGKSNSMGGVGHTNQGSAEIDIPGEPKRIGFDLGKELSERIGLYKATKQIDGRLSILEFAFYTEQRVQGQDIMHVGSRTSIIYKTEDHDLTAILKTEPSLLNLVLLGIVWYRTYTVWGKGRLPSMTFSILH